jgi:hypothetical protein
MTNTAPDGISEDDYEAIEAAVMETVRGRWFLSEYARRSRAGEMRQLLDAVGRLEQVVTEQKAAPADPAIRLLVQRLKDVGQNLNGIAAEMRLLGTDTELCGRVETQARALGGLLRLNGQPSGQTSGQALQAPAKVQAHQQPIQPPLQQVLAQPAPEPVVAVAPQPAPQIIPPPLAITPMRPQVEPVAAPRPLPLVAALDDQSREEIRLTALARLDCLPLAEKLALFN